MTAFVDFVCEFNYLKMKTHKSQICSMRIYLKNDYFTGNNQALRNLLFILHILSMEVVEEHILQENDRV